LKPILNTLRVLREEAVWLEITNLVIPSWTDDLDTITRMCDWLCASGLADSPLHFTRFIPLYKLTQLPTTPVSTLERARDVALKAGVKYVYIGNVPGHKAESTFCPKCGNLIVERRGFVITAKHIPDGHCEYCHERIPGVWS
jgi:pyruvate formate lyase activating enzyme